MAMENNVRAFRCPCKDCKGGQQKTIQVIRQHHAAVGRYPFLQNPLLGGDPLEGCPSRERWVEDIACDIPKNTALEHLEADNADGGEKNAPYFWMNLLRSNVRCSRPWAEGTH